MSRPLFPPLPPGRRPLALALAWGGALLCLLPLSVAFDPDVLALGATYLTALRAVAGCDGSARWRRVVRRLAAAPLLLAYALLAYAAVIVAATAGWALPGWALALAALAAAAALWTHRTPRRGVRVPAVLVLGIITGGGHASWIREESSLRCEDVARALGQAGVVVAVPSTDLARCPVGARRPVGRYPRKVFVSADGSRYLFTTQVARPGPFAAPHAGPLDGSVCAAPVGGGTARCVGAGRGHGLFEAPALGLVFAPVAERTDEHLGLLYELPTDGPWRVRRATPLPLHASNGYYDPVGDAVTVLSDRATVAVQMRGADHAPLPPFPLLVLPHEVRYDAARAEGLVCSGSPITGVATVFRVRPFAARQLHAGPFAPLMPFTWGCDWDADHRLVHASLPALGVLVTVDRASDAVVRWSFVGFGVRPVALDARRGRVYLARFLQGDVVALDPATGRATARWFAGRFVRDLRLTPDGGALLAASNLGVVRIAL